MATQKAEPTESTDTPKKHAITFAKDLSAGEKMEALNAAKRALENELIAELDAEEAELQAKIDDVRKRRNDIFPPMQGGPASEKRTRGPKKEKVQGKLVNDKTLTDLITEAPEGVLNIRTAKLDIAGVKKMAEESKGKFVFTPNGPWPTVSLAK